MRDMRMKNKFHVEFERQINVVDNSLRDILGSNRLLNEFKDSWDVSLWMSIENLRSIEYLLRDIEEGQQTPEKEMSNA